MDLIKRRVNPAILIFATIFIPLIFIKEFFITGDPFTTPKHILLAAVCLLMSLLNWNFNLENKKKEKNYIQIILSVYFIFFIWELISFEPSNVLGSWIERLEIFFIAVTSAQFFAQDFEKKSHYLRWIFIPAFVVTSIGYLQLFHQDLLSLNDYWSALPHASTFGQANMTADFLGMNLLIYVNDLSRTSVRIWKVVLGIFWVVYFCSLGSLSAIFSVLIAIYMFFSRLYIKWIFLAATICAVIVAPRFVLDTKIRNLEDRAQLWKNTLLIAYENPMGVGAGQFSNAYFKFQIKNGIKPSEDWVYQTPHNEFLKLLVENGWIYFIFTILVALLIIKKIFFENYLKSDPLIKALVLFYFFQSLVHFPFENAWGRWSGGLILGFCFPFLGLTVTRNTNPIRLNGWIMRALIIVFVGFSMMYMHSWLLTSRSSLSRLWFSCRFYSIQDRACLQYASTLKKEGLGQESIRILRETLDRNPYNAKALLLQSDLYFSMGRPQDGCQSLWKYDRLFMSTSFWHPYLEQKCPKRWLDAFRIKELSKNTEEDLDLTPAI